MDDFSWEHSFNSLGIAPFQCPDVRQSFELNDKTVLFRARNRPRHSLGRLRDLIYFPQSHMLLLRDTITSTSKAQFLAKLL